MIDYFALLSQPRRPWLELETLKNQFHALAAVQHPDALVSGDTDRFAAVNAAYATLRDPALRLAHLLSLAHPGACDGAPAVPDDLAESFMAIAESRRLLRDVRQRQKRGSSTIVNALLADEAKEVERKLRELVAGLQADFSRAMDELRALDAAWPSRDASTIRCALALQHRLAYLGRWIADLREELVVMSM